MNLKLLLKQLVLVACLMSSLGAVAQEAYVQYWNNQLTFHYDNNRSSCSGVTFDLNNSGNPGWYTYGTSGSVYYVVFNAAFANVRPVTTAHWFDGMTNLRSITGIQNLNTSNVTNMYYMFKDCSTLTTLDVSGFNTSNVTDMSNMFRGCSGLTSLDVSQFNTANVTNMSYMFAFCSGLTSLDVSSFNTAKVTNMSYMFIYCSGLTSLDLSSFNTAKVTDMRYMFYYCSGMKGLDLTGFNTAKVTNMEFMFYRSSNLTSICVDNAWSTDAVTQSDNMFNGCTSLIGFRGTTYDPNYTDKTYAHIDGGPSNPGYLDKKVLQAYACYTPENTTLTFYYDYQRSLRPGTTYNLNTGINHPGWYSDGTNSLVTLAVFDPSFADALPTSTFLWFGNMSNLQSITGMEYLNTSNVTNTESMFYYCSGLTSLDVSHFNTAKVTDMSYMFSLCSGLTRLDLSNFNTVNVTRMVGMFSYCTGLTSLDLSSFNTVNVGSMYSMFFGCSSLTSLDLSNFNTAAVTKMDHMFSNCPGLTTIYVGDGWSTAAVTESSDMFKNCTSLVGGQGTTYDANHVDAEYAHIDGGPSNPGYLTEKPEAYACYTPENTTLTFYYDDQRYSRPGTVYGLDDSYESFGVEYPGWFEYQTRNNLTQVVFDPSFADARPTTTFSWFAEMNNLESISGMEYLNTEEVTDMSQMFYCSYELTDVDLSHFNTSKVTDMNNMFACWQGTTLDLSSFNTSQVTNMMSMFYWCYNLTTIYAGDGWSTASLEYSDYMFNDCTSLVGGMGTTFDGNHIDAAYAHIDGGPSNPGYFSEKGGAFLRGDVNGDGQVKINDVTALIDYLLSGDGSNINVDAADCNQDGQVKINDVTALIDYLLSGVWP